MRNGLDNDAFNALVLPGGVLIDLFAPHACKFCLRSKRSHGSGGTTLLRHSLEAGGLRFGNQALDCHLSKSLADVERLAGFGVQ
jgi:hypothetical protein